MIPIPHERSGEGEAGALFAVGHGGKTVGNENDSEKVKHKNRAWLIKKKRP